MLNLVTGPTVEPVTLDETKLHLRVDITDDDSLIGAKIETAREDVETITRRALITQTWDLYLDAFPSESQIELLMPPLQSVTHVKYTDPDGNESTLSSSSYVVDTYSTPGRIVLKDGESWPGDTLQVVNGVEVQFKAGYGDHASDVPRPIRDAVLLLVGHYYENREAVAVGRQRPVVLPMGVEELLWTYRVLRF